MRVLVVSHGKEITRGWLEDALTAVDANYRVIDPSRGDPMPPGEWDKVILLGGHMGAYEVDAYPWLMAEKDFIKLQLETGTSVLGVCLGAQLVADVIGGRAFRAKDTEAGMLTIQRTEAGRIDPVLSAIDGPVVSWHHDTFDLPPEAELLAHTDDYPHAFRYGSALGVQFHPEVTPGMFRGWVAMAGPEELEEAGLDPVAFAGDLDVQAGRLRHQAVDFFRTWLEE